MFERITRREGADLVIAWMAISISFAIIFLRSIGRADIFTALLFLGVSLLTVGIGFVLHEMAHKFVAIRYGFWAEFRKDNIMLVVAVALAALVGVVFAAPGATVIYDINGRGISREQNGWISASGPIVNLLLCIPFAGLLVSGGAGAASLTGSIITIIGLVGLQVNAMIAAFNMLPVSVLDGRKVADWNIAVFLILIVTAFAVLYVSLKPEILFNLL
ncbi:MAG: peptidase M50 [Methanoregula sp.]|jgi:Zn-dependent protease|nr:peptidase M50 [Methanoregula sp.]